jgi:hypothetical protein
LREQVPMLTIAQAPEDRIGPRAIRQREDIIRKRWPE